MTRRDLDRHAPLAPAHPALVRATVKAREQHPDTRQWTLTVELRGGRIVRGVHPTFPSGGTLAGDLPPLPAIGSRVLVGFAESNEGFDMFALCSFQGHVSGLDRDTPDEAVSLTRSGLGRAVSPDGTITTRWPGGDELVAGPGAGYEFLVRNPEGKPVKPKFPKRALRVLADFSKGGLVLGARLFGGLELIADAAKREIRLALSEKDALTLKPGLMRATTGSLVVGENEDRAASVARAPETEANFEALARELQYVKHEVMMLKARMMRKDVQIELITAYPLLAPIKIPVSLVPIVPLPLITPQGKDGALLASKGGVQIVDVSAKTLHAE